MNNKTIIYSGSKSSVLNDIMEYEMKFGFDNLVFYPELDQNTCDDVIPLHPKEIIQKCPTLLGKTIVTVSEHIILFFLKEIRLKRLTNNDVELYWIDDNRNIRQLRIDTDGELIDNVPGGFFEERGELLFKD